MKDRRPGSISTVEWRMLTGLWSGMPLDEAEAAVRAEADARYLSSLPARRRETVHVQALRGEVRMPV